MGIVKDRGQHLLSKQTTHNAQVNCSYSFVQLHTAVFI